MANADDTLAQARNLMREGQVQAADDLISGYFKALAAGGGTVPEAATEPKPPRAPLSVVHDLVTGLVGLLGNKQELIDLLTELRAVL